MQAIDSIHRHTHMEMLHRNYTFNYCFFHLCLCSVPAKRLILYCKPFVVNEMLVHTFNYLIHHLVFVANVQISPYPTTPHSFETRH